MLNDMKAPPAVLARPEGLTLRDFFAAHALAGLLGLANREEIERLAHIAGTHQSAETARIAFSVADAMLRARELTATPQAMPPPGPTEQAPMEMPACGGQP